jgi:hypothetical protein
MPTTTRIVAAKLPFGTKFRTHYSLRTDQITIPIEVSSSSADGYSSQSHPFILLGLITDLKYIADRVFRQRLTERGVFTYE